MNRVIEKFQEAQVRKDLPALRPGDTVRVHVRLKEGEGDKERIQPFEGVIIKKRGKSTGGKLHRAARELWSRDRAHFPGQLAVHQFHRSVAPGPRAPRQAVLSARAEGQGSAPAARRACGNARNRGRRKRIVGFQIEHLIL